MGSMRTEDEGRLVGGMWKEGEEGSSFTADCSKFKVITEFATSLAAHTKSNQTNWVVIAYIFWP